MATQTALAKPARFNAQATHSLGVGYIVWLLGIFGAHRFSLGKVWTGILWLLTGGLLGFGWLFDLWTLNEQVDEINRAGQ
jgi:TM2 domain-containing membrane protein YozV